MTPELVFVIDSDETSRDRTARLLEETGYLTRCFGSAEEFLAREPLDRAGCIVSDLRLPGMDGLDLFATLHSRGRLIPLVFLSQDHDVPASVRAMKRGAVDFLVKPVRDDELRASVVRAMELDRQLRVKRASNDRLTGLVERLTPRERQVFALVVQGMPNKQIAGMLGIAEQTVKVHRGRVMEKMEADSLVQLVHLAEELGERLTSAEADHNRRTLQAG